MSEINRKEYLQTHSHSQLVDMVMLLEKKVMDGGKECQQIYESEQLFSGIVHGEVKDFKIQCDEGKAFFVKPRVMFDVCTDDETHVPDCTTLEEAERYCKQLNIEDRMGNGRVDFGGETPNDLTGFIEANEQRVRNILALQDDVLAYLATLPEGED